MLKLYIAGGGVVLNIPAAFRRLCVETKHQTSLQRSQDPAAFRRLCVETSPYIENATRALPAAFRRLCVETFSQFLTLVDLLPQPPSGGCVLKQD